jgi:sorbitol-specific phosphotransferase system component IIC
MAHVDGRIAGVSGRWVGRRTASFGLEVNLSTVFSMFGMGLFVAASVIMAGVVTVIVARVIGVLAVIIMIAIVRMSGRECVGRDEQSCGKDFEAKL